jgi:hypothetical protein
LSPEVQVMQQPSFVYSQRQWPSVKLHWQTVIPLQVQLQLHSPSANIRHRFCSVAHATLSSQRQFILNPPLHFSNSIVHRGTTHQLAAAGDPLG